MVFVEGVSLARLGGLRSEAPVQDEDERRDGHRQHDDGRHVGVDGGVDDAGIGGGGIEHEGELAALGHQERPVQRVGVVAAGQPGHAIDAQTLDHHQRDHTRDDDAPVLGHHLQVQRHAHAQEEEPQQQATERLDIGFQLMAEA